MAKQKKEKIVHLDSFTWFCRSRLFTFFILEPFPSEDITIDHSTLQYSLMWINAS